MYTKELGSVRIVYLVGGEIDRGVRKLLRFLCQQRQ